MKVTCPGQVAESVGASFCVPTMVAGLTPSQGTDLGYRLDPRLGYIQDTTHRCFFLFLSLSQNNEYILKQRLKK